MVDFSFIVSLYVSDLPNVTISTVLYDYSYEYCSRLVGPGFRPTSKSNPRRLVQATSSSTYSRSPGEGASAGSRTSR